MTTDQTDQTAKCFGRHAANDPIYAAYHDTEWGRPIHDETGLFERVCLEGFQVGLSWRTILHKRDAFRDRFAGFHPATIAAFGDADIERLVGDTAIIRNRAKIMACVRGAQALLKMHDAGETLDGLIWGSKPEHHVRPTEAIRPDLTPQSEALATALHKRGFRFVGPVNVYATMQACGVVNDHITGCRIGDEIEATTAG